jgi:tRNA pseudouridine55 synthase
VSKRKHGMLVNGVVLLDKPVGLSSNKALQIVRRLFDARKAGHTGSLDPFATGMLPLCFGEASKTAAFMIDAGKTYHAIARLGIATETGDTEGLINQKQVVPKLSDEQIRNVFEDFKGEIEQIPPMFSALKHQGQPLYKLARQGKTIERSARKVVIHRLELHSFCENLLSFEVACSKGTYIRTLAEDLASALGTCAHLSSLRRLNVDPFNATAMVSLPELELAAEAGELDQHLLPIDAGLPDWPITRLASNQLEGFFHGNSQLCPDGQPGWTRVYGPGGQIIGLGETTREGLLKPKRVFNLDITQPEAAGCELPD